jgi:glycosyltransferase involved in cell wall biosynthesis
MKNEARITYVVNNAAFFVSHRLPIAVEAIRKGYLVNLIFGKPGSLTMEGDALKELSEKNIPYHELNFKSSGVNPIHELFGLYQLFRLIGKNKPDLLHCISPKGILYGGIIAKLFQPKGLVIALSGMGFAFTKAQHSNFSRFVISRIYKVLFKFLLSHKNLRVIVQNTDDRNLIRELAGLKSEKIILIGGSGVNLEKYIYTSIESKQPIVLLPGRMLWDKGIKEFVAAAKAIKKVYPQWRFILAGAADYKNPSSIPISFLKQLNTEGLVEWVGYKHNIEEYFGIASIVCLPSYREGMPKCLLEGAAAGCAIVTTDTVGCREAIIAERTGILVPSEDSDSLTLALLKLIGNKSLRENFGRAGRKLAISRYGIDNVIAETLKIYGDLLSCRDEKF